MDRHSPTHTLGSHRTRAARAPRPLAAVTHRALAVSLAAAALIATAGTAGAEGQWTSPHSGGYSTGGSYYWTAPPSGGHTAASSYRSSPTYVAPPSSAGRWTSSAGVASRATQRSTGSRSYPVTSYARGGARTRLP